MPEETRYIASKQWNIPLDVVCIPADLASASKSIPYNIYFHLIEKEINSIFYLSQQGMN